MKASLINVPKYSPPPIIDGQNTNFISGNDYVWKDEKADFLVKGTNGSSGNPSWLEYIPGFQGLTFSGTAMNQVWVDFCINHDIAPNSRLYPHIHWMPLNNTTGVVRWGIQYIIAKGHGQSAFPTQSTTIYINHTVPLNSQYVHMITEVPDISAILSSQIEPDSVIKMRIFRDATNAADTHNYAIHAWQTKLHYQVSRIGTKNKKPPFVV